MEIYYRDRAPEYDKFYEVPERQHDLKRLKSWLVEHVRGRHILEIAAGTGYWTEAAAAVAKAITATDYNPEMLAIAATRNLGSNVKLRTADAFALPNSARRSMSVWRTCGGPTWARSGGKNFFLCLFHGSSLVQ